MFPVPRSRCDKGYSSANFRQQRQSPVRRASADPDHNAVRQPAALGSLPLPAPHLASWLGHLTSNYLANAKPRIEQLQEMRSRLLCCCCVNRQTATSKRRGIAFCPWMKPKTSLKRPGTTISTCVRAFATLEDPVLHHCLDRAVVPCHQRQSKRACVCVCQLEAYQHMPRLLVCLVGMHAATRSWTSGVFRNGAYSDRVCSTNSTQFRQQQ